MRPACPNRQRLLLAPCQIGVQAGAFISARLIRFLHIPYQPITLALAIIFDRKEPRKSKNVIRKALAFW